MYLIDLVYRTVLVIANSDVRGNVKPSDIRLLINTSIEEIYESYFYELNRMLNRQNRGLIGRGIENIPDRIREKINHFSTNKDVDNVSGTYPLPSDLRYLDSAFLGDKEVELMSNHSEFRLVSKTESSNYPIGIKHPDTLVVAPNITSKLSIHYLRNVKIPNWTYFVVNGSEVFNPSAPDFQDLDLHSSEVNNVIIKTLQKVGINLKEQDLQQVMAQKENIEFQQEMTS